MTMERKIELFKVSLIMAFMIANGFLNSAFGGKLKAEDLFQPKKLLEIQIKLSPSDWKNFAKKAIEGTQDLAGYLAEVVQPGLDSTCTRQILLLMEPPSKM